MLIYNNNILNNKLNNIIRDFGLDYNYKSDLLYIIYHLRTYPFKNRDYSSEDFIPVKLEYLRNLITYNKTKYFLDLLTEQGVLMCDDKFIPNVKSKGYKIADTYKKQKFYLEEMENIKLSEKISKILKLVKDEVVKRNDAYSYVTICMENLQINKEKAEKVLEDRKLLKLTKDNMSTMVDRFDEKFAKVDATGNRLHNNLTNISTALRTALNYNGKTIVQCDLKNSQPLLFRIYLEKYPHIPKEELDKYLDVVCNIGFYEFFAKKLGMKLTAKNRTEFKKKIFGGVLFDRNRKTLSKYEKVFKKEFPIIFYCMRDMKKENHADIPINLQKLESKYIFHCIDVLREKYKNIELLTIHDSICTVEGKEDLVYQVMIEEFYKMFNILPKIKVEKFA
jgi:hypothetical protein